jgi:hypothetical protein
LLFLDGDAFGKLFRGDQSFLREEVTDLFSKLLRHGFEKPT